MPSYQIYEAHFRFTKAQKKVPITPEIVEEVRKLFGFGVSAQLERDRQVKFSLWDSASMIEQSWDYFQDHEFVPPVCDWVRWTLEKLGYVAVAQA